jgi:lipopolysaccharide biosynthesis protein
MRRLLVYAHFDPEAGIAPRVRHTLSAFRALGTELVFATTSPVDASGRAFLEGCAARTIPVENIGYDFFAWKTALAALRGELERWDRLVLLNSSVIGPVLPLEPFLRRVEGVDADVVGATISLERHRHLQSWFASVRAPAHRSPAFHAFWDAVTPIPDRQGVIEAYELTMTARLEAAGLSVAAVYEGRRRRNPTLAHPYRLLARGIPFVKLQLLRDNPRGVVLWPIERLVERSLGPAAWRG